MSHDSKGEKFSDEFVSGYAAGRAHSAGGQKQLDTIEGFAAGFEEGKRAAEREQNRADIERKLDPRVSTPASSFADAVATRAPMREDDLGRAYASACGRMRGTITYAAARLRDPKLDDEGRKYVVARLEECLEEVARDMGSKPAPVRKLAVVRKL